MKTTKQTFGLLYSRQTQTKNFGPWRCPEKWEAQRSVVINVVVLLSCKKVYVFIMTTNITLVKAVPPKLHSWTVLIIALLYIRKYYMARVSKMTIQWQDTMGDIANEFCDEESRLGSAQRMSVPGSQQWGLQTMLSMVKNVAMTSMEALMGFPLREDVR